MPATASVIDPADHVDWAEEVGAAIAATFFRPRSADWEDVRAEAVLVLFEKARRPTAEGGFDPAMVPRGGDFGGAFRGWCHPSIRGRCARRAQELRGGGTFWTTRKPKEAPTAGGSVDDLDGTATDPRDYGAAPDYTAEGDGADHVPCGRRLARSLSARSKSA